MKDLPRTIFDTVEKSFNCEDIAMSFMVSSFTGGRPPLLADRWAQKSLVVLYSRGTISGNIEHAVIRNRCVNVFASLLGLKSNGSPNRLVQGELIHWGRDRWFEAGMRSEIVETVERDVGPRQDAFNKLLKSWRQLNDKQFKEEISRMRNATGIVAYEQGLLANTDRWARRFNKTKFYNTNVAFNASN